jgi:hypothetical protein
MQRGICLSSLSLPNEDAPAAQIDSDAVDLHVLVVHAKKENYASAPVTWIVAGGSNGPESFDAGLIRFLETGRTGSDFKGRHLTAEKSCNGRVRQRNPGCFRNFVFVDRHRFARNARRLDNAAALDVYQSAQALIEIVPI